MIKKQIKHGRSHPILRHASAVTTQAIFSRRAVNPQLHIYKKLQTAPTSHSRAAATHGKIRASLQNFSLGKLNFPASPVPSLAYCV
jgi:hypothetical protein